MYMYTYLWKMSLIFSILTNKNKGYTYMNTYKILVLLLIYLKYEKMSVHTCMLFQTTLNQNKWLRKIIIRNFVAMIHLWYIYVFIQNISITNSSFIYWQKMIHLKLTRYPYTHSYTAYSKNQIQGITLIENLNSEPWHGRNVCEKVKVNVCSYLFNTTHILSQSQDTYKHTHT